jgi:quercetin dioxygenase-like cupin family protein
MSFSELPGDRHGVSANASETKPVKLLAAIAQREDRRKARAYA